MKPTLTLLLTATLAGCATGPLDSTGTFLPPLHYQALESAKICCDSLKTIRYAPLQRGVEVKATILPDSPVFEFGGQRSFFAAFELQPGENRFLTITTDSVNMLLNPYGHVMVPSVQFLGEDFKPISIVDPSYKTDSRSQRSWGEASIKIPNSARYSILFDGRNSRGLAWRDRDQISGSLFVRRGPTGQISVLQLGG